MISVVAFAFLVLPGAPASAEDTFKMWQPNLHLTKEADGTYRLDAITLTPDGCYFAMGTKDGLPSGQAAVPEATPIQLLFRHMPGRVCAEFVNPVHHRRDSLKLKSSVIAFSVVAGKVMGSNTAKVPDSVPLTAAIHPTLLSSPDRTVNVHAMRGRTRAATSKRPKVLASQDEGPSIDAGGTYTFGNCHGKERWAVKVGDDDDVGEVDLSAEKTKTIKDLNATKRPSGNPPRTRHLPDESQVAHLTNVRLALVRTTETDCDYHLELRDSAGGHMIGEIPYNGMVPISSPFRQLIEAAAEDFDAHAAEWANVRDTEDTSSSITISLYGVEYFDAPHMGSQPTGDFKNHLEIHPILGICFGTDCDPHENDPAPAGE